MFIFNQDENVVVNSDKIHCFSIFLREYGIMDDEYPWILAADEYELGVFKTQKDAHYELKTIIGLAINGSHEYRVGKSNAG